MKRSEYTSQFYGNYMEAIHELDISYAMSLMGISQGFWNTAQRVFTCLLRRSNHIQPNSKPPTDLPLPCQFLSTAENDGV